MRQKSALAVESYLSKVRAENIATGIWKSHNEVIERLLASSGFLDAAWAELFDACPPGSRAPGTVIDRWQWVVDTIIAVAAGWSPKKVKETRDAVRHVSDLTADIGKKAAELAELLRRRTNVCEQHGISKQPIDFHPVDLFESAAQIAGNYNNHTYFLFKNRVLPCLEDLSDRFDLKYWPRTADLIEALKEANDNPDLSVNLLSDVATASRQASRRDFMRALDCSLGDLMRHGIEISFSHAAYADIVNAILDLDGKESRESIKKYRADERKSNG